MLWLGLSALLVGIISLCVDWPWQYQLVAFAVFALASIPAWRHFARRVEKPSRPARSSIAARMAIVGREFTLEKPIVDGHRHGADRRHDLARDRARTARPAAASRSCARMRDLVVERLA